MMTPMQPTAIRITEYVASIGTRTLKASAPKHSRVKVTRSIEV
jgi:hypothetical protein